MDIKESDKQSTTIEPSLEVHPLSPSISAKIANMGFVCACLVVGVHVSCEAPSGVGFSDYFIHFFKCGLCRIAVPYFFLISGYLLANHSRGENWWFVQNKKRIRTLLIPYLAWSSFHAVFGLVLILFHNILSGFPLFRGFPVFSELLPRVLGLYPAQFPLYIPFWYIRNLVLLCLVSPIIVCAVSGRRWLAWSWMVFVSCLYLTVPSSNYYVFYENHSVADVLRKCFSVEGLAYFSIGAFLSWRTVALKIENRLLVLIGFLACLLFVWTIWAEVNDLPWYPYPRVFALPLSLLVLWKVMPSNHWRHGLIGSSFAIYCLHSFILQLLAIFNKGHLLFGYEVSGWIRYLSLWGMAIVFSLVTIHLMRRFAPGLTRVVLGGR